MTHTNPRRPSYVINSTVTATSGMVGGLVGLNGGTIDSSYMTGSSISGQSDVGGLAGSHGLFGGGLISNCYVGAGAVNATVQNVGGLIGTGVGGVSNSYFNVDAVTTNGGNNVTVAGLHATQYNDWFNGGALTPLVITNYASLVLQGDGSYGINSQQGMMDMLGFADDLAPYNFSLTGNIDLATMPGFNVPELRGNFNGNDFTISNLSLNLPNSGVGLFGNSTSGSLISNIHLVDINVSGYDTVGGLVGDNTANIVNASVTGNSTVTGVGALVGGLVGYNFGADISGSHALNVTVNGNFASQVGGLVGFSQGGTIDASYVVNGNVSGSGNIGGMVGADGGEGGFVTISNSYVENTIVLGSNSSVGGLAGRLNGSISGSYVTGGSVSGGSVSSGGNIGGLVGYNFAGSISNSYVDSGTVLLLTGDGAGYGGGLVGYNAGSIDSSFVNNTTVGMTTGASAWTLGGLAGYNTGNISNTYVSGGSVSASSTAGGLVGSNSGTIDFSYVNAGSVSVTGFGTVGGVVGRNTFSGSVSNTFWNTALAGVTFGIGNAYPGGGSNTGAAGLTTAQMQTMFSFAGWSIANTGGAGMTWRIYEGQTMPLLASFLKPLNVSVAGSRAYDGTTDVSGLVTYSDGQGPAVPDVNLITTNLVADTSSPNAGTYTVTPSGLYSTQLGYDVSYASGSVNITSASLTLLSVTAANASKIYGVTYTFDGTEFTPVGLVGSDTISGVTLTSAGAESTANVGAYAITPSNAVFSVGSAGNYDITYVNGTLTVTQRTVTISALAASKVYGSADPNLFTVGGSGLASFDTKSTAFTGSLSHTGGENVGTGYVITQGTLTANSNYSISGFTDNILTITPATLAVIADAINKVLGTPDPALTFTVNGLQFSDTASGTVSVSLVRDPGELIGLYTINGSATLLSSNYTLMPFVPGTFTILPPTVVQEITQISLSNGTPEGEDDDEKKKYVLAALESEGGQGGNLPDNLPVCR